MTDKERAEIVGDDAVWLDVSWLEVVLWSIAAVFSLGACGLFGYVLSRGLWG